VSIETFNRSNRIAKRVLLPCDAHAMQGKNPSTTTTVRFARAGHASQNTTAATSEEYAEAICLSDVMASQNNGFIGE
jgi:hypothetical protein